MDERLHEQLVQAELEDCAILHREVSAYLEFWLIARPAGSSPAPAARADAATATV